MSISISNWDLVSRFLIFTASAILSVQADGPENDDFKDAVHLGGAYPIIAQGSTNGPNGKKNASRERGEPRHGNLLGSGSVWYRWKPALPGRYEIRVDSEDLDIILAVYTGDDIDTLKAASRYEGLDSPTVSFKAQEPFTTGARVEFDASHETAYFIAVDGDHRTSGDFTIQVDRFKNSFKPQALLLAADSNWRYFLARDAKGKPINPESLDYAFHQTWFVEKLYKGPFFKKPSPAPLGYGELDSLDLKTFILGDKNAIVPRGHRFTAYFRTQFTPEIDVNSLGIQGVFDDGAIIFLNGKEVARVNIDQEANPHHWKTMALNEEDPKLGPTEKAIHHVKINDLNLPKGEVVDLGVSLHNATQESSDLGFEMQVFSLAP